VAEKYDIKLEETFVWHRVIERLIKVHQTSRNKAAVGAKINAINRESKEYVSTRKAHVDGSSQDVFPFHLSLPSGSGVGKFIGHCYDIMQRKFGIRAISNGQRRDAG